MSISHERVSAVMSLGLNASELGFAVNGIQSYQVTPPAVDTDAETEGIPTQSVADRAPPTPPPLPVGLQPWYFIMAPEVAWAKLDKKDAKVADQEMPASEGSQGRGSASRVTPTSTGGTSRTPSKSRMRMVKSSQRSRSRSHKPNQDLDDQDTTAKTSRSSDEEDSSSDTSEASVEVTSSVSSDSDTDMEETDGTDTETDETLEFKKAVRSFSTVRYPGAQISSSPLVIGSRKRKPFLEETLPDTYGPKHTSKFSRSIAESSKSGSGPRAIAQKSFARAIGARILSKRRYERRS